VSIHFLDFLIRNELPTHAMFPSTQRTDASHSTDQMNLLPTINEATT